MESAGATIVPAPEGPDAVDMTMGAHIDGFIRAWEDIRGDASQVTDASSFETETETDADEIDATDEPFVVPRALDALIGDVQDASDRDMIAGALRAAASLRAEESRERWATETFANLSTESESFPGDAKAALMVVTTDNDLAPCLRRCRAAGISRDHMRRLPTTTETRRGQEDQGWPKIGLIRRRRGVSLFLFLFPYVQLD